MGVHIVDNRIRSHVTVKLDFRRYTHTNENFEYCYPLNIILNYSTETYTAFSFVLSHEVFAFSFCLFTLHNGQWHWRRNLSFSSTNSEIKNSISSQAQTSTHNGQFKFPGL